MEEKVFSINGDTITTLYSDELRELGGAGATLHVHRASFVEFNHDLDGWTVFLATGGWLACDEHGAVRRVLEPPLPTFAWPTRGDALAAEVAFLQARL